MKEKTSKLISCICKMIQDLFNIIIQITKWVFASTPTPQNTLTEKDKLNIAIHNMMHQMTIDLYRAFHAHSYNLFPIKTVESIRLYNWKLQNGYYFYQFTIEKKSTDKIPAFLLKQMKDDMNTDICSARDNILYFEDLEYLFYTFPFLYHGIKVISVYDSGSSHIIITVCSRLTPQNFIKIYRQDLL